jgi:type IV secretory pathway VirB2 component (pilin)
MNHFEQRTTKMAGVISRMGLWLACLLIYPRAANAQQVIEQMRKMGSLAIDAATVLGGIGAVLGLIKAGQAFNEGNAEEGWQRLKSTLLGIALIFGAAGIVQLMSSQIGGHPLR